MAEALRLASNATKARLFDASREVKLALAEFLSYQVEGADQSDAFKAKRWDGRSSFLDFKLGTFPAGFVPVVLRELRAKGHSVSAIEKPAPAPLGPELGSVDYLGYGFVERYDYQPETVRRLLHHKRMVAQVATGGGKSNIAVLATGTIRRPTLFLTTRTVLMDQMAGAFERSGMTPGIIGDGIWAPRKGVTCGMVQTLASRLSLHKDPASLTPLEAATREQTLKLLRYFEFVIGEEAHEAGGGAYFDIMGLCENAHWRLALTATPFMRADGEANMRLMAAFGPIGIQISEDLLIQRGILATPTFKLVRTPCPPMLRRTTKWPVCYELGVVENIERNKAVIFEAHRAAGYGLPVMVLVQRKKHGETLRKAMIDAGMRVEFIFGQHENTERRHALNRLKSGETQVLIGSTILDVGVDVPSVGMVILAGGGKAEVAHRQRIGRGLREKHPPIPNTCFVVDFADDFNKTLQTHALTRRAILEMTPGFKDNILAEGVDFNYGAFNRA